MLVEIFLLNRRFILSSHLYNFLIYIFTITPKIPFLLFYFLSIYDINLFAFILLHSHIIARDVFSLLNRSNLLVLNSCY